MFDGCGHYLNQGKLACLRGRSSSVGCYWSAEQSYGSDGYAAGITISMQAESFTSMVPVGRTMSTAGVVVTGTVWTVGPYKPLVMKIASMTWKPAFEAWESIGLNRDSNSVWLNSEKDSR